MKRNRMCTSWPLFSQLGRKWQLVMRISIVLLFGIFFQVSASGWAQKVKINQTKTTYKALFKEIERQTGMITIFSNDEIDMNEKVVLNQNELDLAELFDVLFEGTNLDYRIVDEYIVVKPVTDITKRTTPVTTQQTQQKVTVKGSVFDEHGNPLPFAAIQVKGTGMGTITNENGEYAIELDSGEGVILVVSSLGFQNQEVSIDGRKTVDITMTSDSVGLDEVVAIGYGSSTKRDLTGAVASLRKEKLESVTAGTTVDAALRGTAGVSVVSGSGPGAPVRVKIRGISSLSGDTDPLYIVDGVRIPTDVSRMASPSSTLSGEGQIEDQLNALLNIDMSDVESIDVLKDASSCAIYGSRASNGVVIIKTKRGRKGMKPQLSFQSDLTFETFSKEVEMMNATEYADFMKTAVAATEDLGIDVPEKFKDEDVYNTEPNTNWLDEVSRTGIRQKHSLSIIGGTKSGGYYGSVSMLDHKGMIKGTDLKTLSGRFNFDSKIGDFIRFDLNVSMGNTLDKKGAGTVRQALAYQPNIPVYDENGEYYRPDENSENPVAKTTVRNDFEKFSMQGSVGLEFNLTPYLTFSTRPTVHYMFEQQHGFYPSYTYQGGLQNGDPKFNGLAMESYNKRTLYDFENLLTFNKVLGKHHVTSLLGSTYDESHYYGLSTQGSNVTDDDRASNIGTASTLEKISDSTGKSAMLSYFFRNEYHYAHKYYLNFSIRRDGSSRFGKDKRFGYFPAVGVAWTISEEGFYKNLGLPEVMDFAKFRVSYGQVGNQDIGDGLQYTNLVGTSYGEEPAYYLSTLGNAELQWESTKEFDVGTQLSFLDGLFYLNAGYYKKKTDNLLYRADVAPSLPTSYNGLYQNIAHVENEGVELDLSANIINRADHTLRLGFNISQNRQTVLKLSTDEEQDIQGYTVMEPGHTLGTFWGLVSDGLIQTQEEVDELNEKAYIMSGGTQNYYHGQYKGPGDVKYEDINKDGVINNDDRTYLGSPEPDFFGGFDTYFRWKNLSVSAYFSYAVGGKRYWAFEADASKTYGLNNKPKMIVDDSWSEDNRDARYPRMLVGPESTPNGTFSDYFLHDASYLRLDNLFFQYDIKKTSGFLKKMQVSEIKLTANISNVFTITDYPGFDPTFAGTRRASGMGIDGTVYPPSRSYSLGLKVVF